MRRRFKSDLKDHEMYSAKAQRQIRNTKDELLNYERIPEINSYFEDNYEIDPKFEYKFQRYFEKNKNNVRYCLNLSSLPLRAKKLMRGTFEDYETHSEKPVDTSKKCVPPQSKHAFKNKKIDDFQELVEGTNRYPTYNFRDVEEEEGDYYGKASNFFQYWLQESRDEVMDKESCSLFFNALRHQRNFTINSSNFKPGFKEKAKIVDELIVEESKKLSFNVELRPSREKKLRKELKGTASLRSSKKWFDRVCKTKPHNEVLVRRHIQSWMKKGLPSANAVYRSSKARFYRKIYFNVLDGCCKYFRGKYLEEDAKMRKNIFSLIGKAPNNSNQQINEGTIYQLWLISLNISYAICTYSREMQISFNDFCMLPNDMFRIAIKNCLSEYRNLVVKRYSEEPRFGNKHKLSEQKFDLENKIKFSDQKRLIPPNSSMSRKTRMPVHKLEPYSSYDSHLVDATRRRLTLVNIYPRRYKLTKQRYATFVRIGTIAKHCRKIVHVVNRKRLAVRGTSFWPVFDAVHKTFSKTERSRCNVPRKRGTGSRMKEGSRSTQTSFLSTEEPMNVLNKQSDEIKMDGHQKKEKKGNDFSFLKKRSYLDGIISKNVTNDKNDYLLRNYSRVLQGEEETKAAVGTDTLPKDTLFFQSSCGTNYALHRHQAYMSSREEIYRKINESRFYNLGYPSEMFYWIRAYFEEYRRFKKSLTPVSYSFRKAYYPDPYTHFCPIYKVPKLDWMIIKLQDNERISNSLTFDYVILMKQEILKNCENCFERKEYLSSGINYFTSMRVFQAFKGLPCESCFPDFKGKKHRHTRLDDGANVSEMQEKKQLKSLKKTCCGLSETSGCIKSENVPSTLSLSQDDVKYFDQIFSDLKNDILILGNIHHTKEEKYKENILSPIVRASKGFFKKYLGEYLCLFTKEQTVLGTLYNYKVVRRQHDYYSWPAFAELMTDESGKFDTDLIKASRVYIPYHTPVRKVEAEQSSLTGYKGVKKKYYTDVCEHLLTHEYTFLKYKELDGPESELKPTFSNTTLTEILTNIEAIIKQECAAEDLRNSQLTDIGKFVKSTDDSDSTIYDQKKDMNYDIMSKSDTMLFEHMAYDSLVETESDLQLPIQQNKNAYEIDTDEGALEPTTEASDNGYEIPQTVVAYSILEPDGVVPSNPHAIRFPKQEIIRSSVKMRLEGEKYRRALVFQINEKDRISSQPSSRGTQNYFKVPVEKDDGATDSVSLTYDEVVRQVATKSDSSIHTIDKEMDNASNESNSIIDATSFTSEVQTTPFSSEYGDEVTGYYHDGKDRLKDLWFYDKSGRIKKHVNRRKRIVAVDEKNLYPAECALTTESYYRQLSTNTSKKKVMNFVLNCWNAHQERWCKRQEIEKNKFLDQKKNKSTSNREKEKERVFWRNRKLKIDEHFRTKEFNRTEENSYHHEFFKSRYNSLQYWLHKTLVDPKGSTSTYLKEFTKNEEDKGQTSEKKSKQENTTPSDTSKHTISLKETFSCRKGNELDLLSDVWKTFWNSWKMRSVYDVQDSNVIYEGKEVDSDEESIHGSDLVLGFPKYSFSENNPLRKFEAKFEKYIESNKFNNDLVEEFSEAMHDGCNYGEVCDDNWTVPN